MSTSAAGRRGVSVGPRKPVPVAFPAAAGWLGALVGADLASRLGAGVEPSLELRDAGWWGPVGGVVAEALL
jgi:hypothetical protein